MATSIAGRGLIIAGGGSGAGLNGTNSTSGGGAGGMIYDSNLTFTVQAYTITVGTGGIGASESNGNQGNDTVAFGYTAKGGGKGLYGRINPAENGVSGGSGGGAKGNQVGTAGVGGTSIGTPTQGNAGGAGQSFGSGFSGGGGGAGGAGGTGNGPGSSAGTPLANSISGSSVSYAGGGDADFNSSNFGYAYTTPGSGSSGRSGGGSTSPAGKDGIVIASIPKNMVTATGGTKTTVGLYDIWTFTASGTFTISAIADPAPNPVTLVKSRFGAPIRASNY